MTSGLAVWGGGGHAKVVIDALRAAGAGPVVGVISRSGRVDPDLETAVYPTLAALLEADPVRRFVIAIGDNHTRWRIGRETLAAVPDGELVTVVHPSAVVAPSVVLGPGTVVLAGAILNPGTVTGAGVILNTACSVDHDARLGNYASIAPGAVLGGNVTIGERAAVSLGASVIHGRTIGRDTVVGAGAVVVKDVPAEVVAHGVPARVVRDRRPDEPYL